MIQIHKRFCRVCPPNRHSKHTLSESDFFSLFVVLHIVSALSNIVFTSSNFKRLSTSVERPPLRFKDGKRVFCNILAISFTCGTVNVGRTAATSVVGGKDKKNQHEKHL